jgi:DME family drug/metabolite transporter
MQLCFDISSPEVLSLKRNIILGYMLVLTAAVLWGAVPIITRLLYATGCTPSLVSSVRCYFAAAVSLAALFLTGEFRNVRAADIPFFIVYGVFAIGLTTFFYASATRLLPTSMAAMLLYTSPAFVNILDRIFFGERITKIKLCALLCTLGGCALVVRVYDPGSFRANIAGIIFGLLSGFCYSLTTVLSRRRSTRAYSGRARAWLILIFGSLACCFIQPPWTVGMRAPSQFALLALLAVMGSFIPFTLYLGGIGCGIDGGSASVAAMLEPVSATVYASIFFSDSLDPMQALGIAVVLAGIIVPIIYEKKNAVRASSLVAATHKAS